MRNYFPFLQPIRFQCGTGLHQIHNQPRKAHGRRQFHRTVQMHDFRLHAARGEMAARKLIVFEHQNAMGNAPAHALFDAVKVRRADGSEDRPARSFADYRVRVDAEAMPKGVSVRELL